MHKYFNIKKAASYCGYNAAYFGRIMEEYNLPKYGPKGNRLKATDLDAWMVNPMEFMIVSDSDSRTGFTRVK